MATIKDLLRDKGYDVWATRPDATVLDALRLMADKNIGAILVMDGEALVGIMSERDYARKVILEGKSSKDTLVSEIMTPRVLCVRATQSIDECMGLMTQWRVRHLPVLGEDDRVIGVVSIGDLGKAIIANHEFTIAQLEHYITGTDNTGFGSH
jgi:CBS domain-containing protein